MSITGPRQPRSEDLQRGQPLTPRESEVMDYLTLGMTNREISVALVVTIKTVENHISKIMYKVGLGRRVLLALWWKEQLT